MKDRKKMNTNNYCQPHEEIKLSWENHKSHICLLTAEDIKTQRRLITATFFHNQIREQLSCIGVLTDRKGSDIILP